MFSLAIFVFKVILPFFGSVIFIKRKNSIKSEVCELFTDLYD